MSTIEQAAREIADDIDIGELSETHIRRLLTPAEYANNPLTSHLEMAQRKVREHHVEAIAAILRKRFGPSEPRIERAGPDSFYVVRSVLGGYEYCGPRGWRGYAYCFPTRETAEAAYQKAKEQP